MGIMDIIKGDRIYLDTNIFIYALEAYPEFVSTLTSLFTAIDEGKLTAMTSELTLAEVLIKPMTDNNEDLKNIYLETLRSSETFFIIPVNRQILIEAARIRAKSESLHLPDAIHLAIASVHHCTFFSRMINVWETCRIFMLSSCQKQKCKKICNSSALVTMFTSFTFLYKFDTHQNNCLLDHRYSPGSFFPQMQ